MANAQRYIVYFKATSANNIHNGLWVSAAKSSADAQTFSETANQVSAITNVYGAGTLEHTTALVSIPHGVVPLRGYYNETTRALTATQIVSFPARAAFQAWHDRGDELSRILAEFGPIDYPQWALNLAHDALHAWHIFGYVLWHWTAVPVADKLRALQMASLGPTDVDDARNQRYDRNDPQTIFPIMTDLWEGADLNKKNRLRTIGERSLAPVRITIETNGDVTLAPQNLDNMLTEINTPLQNRPVPGVSTLDSCSYIEGIND